MSPKINIIVRKNDARTTSKAGSRCSNRMQLVTVASRDRKKRNREPETAAAQEQALRTNYCRAKNEKDETSPLCRMGKHGDDTVSHTVSECSKLAQSE